MAEARTVYAVQPWPAGRYKRYRSRNGCVRNACMLAWDHPEELRIVKGYAKGRAPLWLAHWWCVDADGLVVDPSWKNDGRAYVGFETLTAKEAAAATLDEREWVVGLPQIADNDVAEELDRLAEGVGSG